MLFNSLEYLFFYVSVLIAGWLLVGVPKLRIWVLLLASYYFYTINNHWLILLILVSTQIDYVAALRIAASRSPTIRRLYLALSIVTNLGILGFFKYCNFFLDSVVDLASVVGLNLSWTTLNVVLPVGISFYTFQSMSYTIDVYRGQLIAERSWYRFAFYVAYFPQLIAGPIMRASQFMPQVPKRPRLTADQLQAGLYLIVRGLFKKIVLGDSLGRIANPVFGAPQLADGPTAWLGLYAFTFQIYFDFSGYSDIAIGCSRLMGYELPDNFRRPYMAIGFSDFWRRWHISLSSWLRDYLYIPLGGNRTKTRWGVYRNLMLTMLLGGLWHGAAWHFVAWGGLHGTYLAIERALGRRRSGPPERHPGSILLVRRLLVFHMIVLTWLVFRCETLADVGRYLHALMRFDAPATVTVGMLTAAAAMAAGWLAQLAGELREPALRFLTASPILQGAVYAAAAIVIAVFNFSGPTPFIYFRF